MLMPPISAVEMNVAISMGGVTRGIVVAIVSLPCIHFLFVELSVSNLWAIIFYSVFGSLFLSLLVSVISSKTVAVNNVSRIPTAANANE